MSSALRVALACAALGSSAALANATVIIQNDSPAGVGFNDPTPATPVGGNPGTTLGQQRLYAFQYAAAIWGAILDSPAAIVISADFQPLPCSANSAVLGSTRPGAFDSSATLPLSHTWYASALSEALGASAPVPGTPEIVTTFNSDLGQPSCLSGYGFYLGLDNNHGASESDLVSVALHEFAHGLGFMTPLNPTSGAEFSGMPDVFESLIFDDTAGKSWTAMTDAQRQASAINPGQVVWSGYNVTALAPYRLGPLLALEVSAPATLAGQLAYGTAAFGGTIPDGGITGALQRVMAQPGADGGLTTACGPVEPLTGNVALVDRGNCTFVEKALAVQDAGALLMLVADNKQEALPPNMAGSPDAGVTIPCFSVTQDAGAVLAAALDAGTSIQLQALYLAQRQGADPQNHALLFTPSSFVQGSSVSHFDESALPPLLMEPYLQSNQLQAVDLTLPALEDLGWPASPRLTLTITKLGASDQVNPGGNALYLVTVVNQGGVDALNVVVSANPPTGLSFRTIQGSCTNGSFPCLVGTVPAGQYRTIAVSVPVPLSYAAPNPVLFSASFVSTPSPVGSDAVAALSLPVRAAADLSIIGPDGGVGINAGQKAIVALSVVNNGPSVAQSVTVQSAASGATFQGFSGDCQGKTCSFPSLQPGASKSVKVTFAVSGGFGTGTLNVGSTVISDTQDPYLLNNSSVTSIPVTAKGCSTGGGLGGPALLLLPLVYGLLPRRRRGKDRPWLA
jgi:uncharacterized repeat protein (TIGR01451 family)